MDILVAKSYQDLPKIGEVFISSGKSYINVQLKSGKIRAVRTYTEKEYAKLYAVPAQTTVKWKPLREMLGFKNGFITIFRGNQQITEEWFAMSNARYHMLWQWYVVSTEPLPDNIPYGIEPVRLYWADVAENEDKLKPDEEVKKAVAAALNSTTVGEYVGQIGQRLDLTLVIDKAVQLDTQYGTSTMHIMHDDTNNQFIWTTSAKNWAMGSVHQVRGTVKDHREYEGVKQTILKNCRAR